MNRMTHQLDPQNLILITGGARSGKSELAESIALEADCQVYYLATMQRFDTDLECTARIEKHRQRRPANWTTIESSHHLEETVQSLPPGPGIVIIDCLSLYVSNLLLDGYEEGTNPYQKETCIAQAIEQLLMSIGHRDDLRFVVVTNETGSGVVPVANLGRAYRDLLGTANQAFARQASTVWLTVCGQKLRIK